MNVDALKQAARQNPKNPEIHRDLGRALFSVGQVNDALRALKKAARLAPGEPLVHNNLGAIFRHLGRTDEAILSLRKAIELRPDLGSANYNLGMILVEQKEVEEALPFLAMAMKNDPDDFQCRLSYSKALARAVPPWHFPMLHDGVRNTAYQNAINETVKEGMQVLEIGTGSGLLAMMAVKAGASHVTTCERVPEIAAKASEIIKLNGFQDRINVVCRHSTDLSVGQDLPERADVLISEILGSAFLGEKVLTSVGHARRELLKPDAPMIPLGGATMAGLVDLAGVEQFVRSGQNVMGFDLSPFDDLAPVELVLDTSLNPVLLSSGQPVYEYDLSSEIILSPEKRIDFPVTRDGCAIGAAIWMRIRLTDDVVIDNAPPQGLHMHWPIYLYRFKEPRNVRVGDIVSLKGGTDGSEVWVHE
jgi:hypothetical protein